MTTSYTAPFVIIVLILSLAACSGSQTPASADQSITNNQEEGVDEGGIVKAWGDYLVVLRRGRLFTVRVGDRDLEPVCMVDAFPPGTEFGTWYDEMLLSDHTVVVVGYSYQVGATELGLFELSDDGCIQHRATYFLQSNDYYSSRNYASRLVEGQLVFYMPHVISGYRMEGDEVIVESALPSLWRHLGYYNSYDEWGDLIQWSEIQLPVGNIGWPTLHTVVTCDLSLDVMECGANGIIGGFGRTFYVSPEAVYVWVSDGTTTFSGQPPAVAYRLPLDGSESGSVRVFGSPVDQFSFQEGDDGYLNVLVREFAGGDWMWQPERSHGDVALARIPLELFTAQGHKTEPVSYTSLPFDGDGYYFINRFVGDYLLYGSNHYNYESGSMPLFAHPLGGDAQTSTLDLSSGLDRIEAMGDDAVVIGSTTDGLAFTSVSLNGHPEIVDQFVREGAYQGEHRSHGFFFHSEGEGQGVVGLPIQDYSSYHGYLYDNSAAILYLDVEDLQFDQLGTLGARADQINDNCVVSCVDWYGNSRPIFYRGRVFALMGYELVEGVIRNQNITEVARVHLIGDLPQS